MTEQIAEWLVNTIATYPSLIVWLIAVYVVASTVVNFLRGMYGTDESKRPRWVNGTLSALDPFAGNFWKLLPKRPQA